MKSHILVVEDDHQTLITLAYQLEYAGYRVTQAATGDAAIALLETEWFDVVLSDIILGDVTGIDVLHIARQQPYNPQVILLTGHGTLESSLAAFRKGAYDYLLKPCEPEDLLACVARAIERRGAEQQLHHALTILAGHTPNDNPHHRDHHTVAHTDTTHRHHHFGALTIGKTRHEVLYNGQQIRLTPIEYNLLRFLADNVGQVCHFHNIVQHTHGFETNDTEAQQLLKPHIHNVRQKITGDYIVSYRGVGYMFVNPDKTSA